MALNCKPGDLAVIVRSVAGNEGRIVRCGELVHHAIYRPDGIYFHVPCWTLDEPIVAWGGRVRYTVEDECLRPLRDNDGEDEMLRIAGKPQEVSNV